MRITFISDTHQKHRYCEDELPGGDLLLHAGDFMTSGYSKAEAVVFFDWFNSIKGYDKKVFIGGNHDRILEIDTTWSSLTIQDYPKIIYLQDEGFSLYDLITDKSVKIYGSPWQPEFYNWAFNLPRMGTELEEKWKNIPLDTDILITHGPAWGHLDTVIGQTENLGCELLSQRIETVKPKIHVCGHIHTGYGYKFVDGTHYFNAAVLDERYAFTQKPMTVEWNPETNELEFVD
jgi:Icc-related predicted phosphoesterase